MFYPNPLSEEIPKLPLFEKPLTPSDVGKLNRLVIPKQHAENCFPAADNCSLLSFQDEIGKSWRFRYSYWSSSQSYVLTKGWSRFVKEKNLDAGDIVVFARHPSDAGRLFIGWRRRISSTDAGSTHDLPHANRLLHSPQPYQTDHYIHAGSDAPNETATVRANCKRLRLFGVNLECQPDEPEPTMPSLHPFDHYYTDATFSEAAANHQR